MPPSFTKNLSLFELPQKNGDEYFKTVSTGAGMSSYWGWETLWVVLTLIGVFFVGLVGFTTLLGLAVGLLYTLVIFVVPKRWRQAIIQAAPSFWPAQIRHKYLATSSTTGPS